MKKILVIENEGIILLNIITILKSQGFNVIDADNGYTGIQLAKQFIPDLILCNIVMTGINGYEVLKQLRNDPITERIPLMFITAQTTQNKVDQGEQLEANGYLTKPFTSNELLEAIAKFL
jgi:CheY-like chemotaxis protein